MGERWGLERVVGGREKSEVRGKARERRGVGNMKNTGR